MKTRCRIYARALEERKVAENGEREIKINQTQTLLRKGPIFEAFPRQTDETRFFIYGDWGGFFPPTATFNHRLLYGTQTGDPTVKEKRDINDKIIKNYQSLANNRDRHEIASCEFCKGLYIPIDIECLWGYLLNKINGKPNLDQYSWYCRLDNMYFVKIDLMSEIVMSTHSKRSCAHLLTPAHTCVPSVSYLRTEEPSHANRYVGENQPFSTRFEGLRPICFCYCLPFVEIKQVESTFNTRSARSAANRLALPRPG